MFQVFLRIVTYGLAAVSKKASPLAMMYNATRKNPKVNKFAAGMNSSAPIAYKTSPSRIPFL